MGIGQEADLALFVPRMAAALGEGYILSGRGGDAVALLTQAAEQTRVPHMAGFQALCSLPLAGAYLCAGRPDEAHALAERTLELARQYQERSIQAYALHLLGEIVTEGNSPKSTAAEDYYQHALTLAQELGMRPLMAHCHLGLGRLALKRGRREQTRSEIGAAIDLYHAMQMRFWLPQAEAALAWVEERFWKPS
jgi:tetratricopeptide (TPR) repeat protein